MVINNMTVSDKLLDDKDGKLTHIPLTLIMIVMMSIQFSYLLPFRLISHCVWW
jgi:hypothetical protein